MAKLTRIAVAAACVIAVVLVAMTGVRRQAETRRIETERAVAAETAAKETQRKAEALARQQAAKAEAEAIVAKKQREIADLTSEVRSLSDSLKEIRRDTVALMNVMEGAQAAAQTGGDEELTKIYQSLQAKQKAFDDAFEAHPVVVALREESRQLNEQKLVLSTQHGELSKDLRTHIKERKRAVYDAINEAAGESKRAIDAVVKEAGKKSVRELDAAGTQQVARIQENYRQEAMALSGQVQKLGIKDPFEEKTLAEFYAISDEYSNVVARIDRIEGEISDNRTLLIEQDSKMAELYAALSAERQKLTKALGKVPEVMETHAKIRQLESTYQATERQVARLHADIQKLRSSLPSNAAPGDVSPGAVQ